MSLAPLIAVDVGNSRIKAGLFRETVASGLPEPETTLHLTGRLPEFEQLGAWLNELARFGESTPALVPGAVRHKCRG